MFIIFANNEMHVTAWSKGVLESIQTIAGTTNCKGVQINPLQVLKITKPPIKDGFVCLLVGG